MKLPCFIIILLPLVLHFGEHDLTHNIFERLKKKFFPKKVKVTWTETCYGNQDLPLLHTHVHACAHTHTHTHARRSSISLGSTSGNDVGIVKRFQILSRKPLGYKKNHPTSNKAIWDLSAIWDSPVLLYSNKLVLGFLSQLLLLLLKMYESWQCAGCCTQQSGPMSLGCVSIKWYHLWQVLSPGIAKSLTRSAQ